MLVSYYAAFAVAVIRCDTIRHTVLTELAKRYGAMLSQRSQRPGCVNLTKSVR